MKNLLTAGFTGLSILLSAYGAQAQASQFSCVNDAEFKRAERMLFDDYGERLTFIAARNLGGTIRIYVNKETATYTLIGQLTNGLFCPLDAGAAWKDVSDDDRFKLPNAAAFRGDPASYSTD